MSQLIYRLWKDTFQTLLSCTSSALSIAEFEIEKLFSNTFLWQSDDVCGTSKHGPDFCNNLNDDEMTTLVTTIKSGIVDLIRLSFI